MWWWLLAVARACPDGCEGLHMLQHQSQRVVRFSAKKPDPEAWWRGLSLPKGTWKLIIGLFWPIMAYL